MATGQEQFNRQFNDSIRLLCDLTSRMEERIKNNNDTLQGIEDMLKDLKEDVVSLEKTIIILSNDYEHSKIIVTEMEETVQGHVLKMDAVVKTSSETESRLGKIIDYTWKLGFLLLSGYIYYKFGWNLN